MRDLFAPTCTAQLADVQPVRCAAWQVGQDAYSTGRDEALSWELGMKNCATCKHAEPNMETDVNGIETEQELFNGQRVYTCRKTEMRYRERVDETSLAVAQDASGYNAALEVLETFGCVMHEENES